METNVSTMQKQIGTLLYDAMPRDACLLYKVGGSSQESSCSFIHPKASSMSVDSTNIDSLKVKISSPIKLPCEDLELDDGVVNSKCDKKRTSLRTRKPTKIRRLPLRWLPAEDQALAKVVEEFGITGSVGRESGASSPIWKPVADCLNNGRTSKQCRDRWLNYLRPGIKKGSWTGDEEELIIDMYTTIGPKWTTMAKFLKDRTDNDIKNKWYAMVRKEERLKHLVRNGRGDPKSTSSMCSFSVQSSSGVDYTKISRPINHPEESSSINGRCDQQLKRVVSSPASTPKTCIMENTTTPLGDLLTLYESDNDVASTPLNTTNNDSNCCYQIETPENAQYGEYLIKSIEETSVKTVGV